MLWYLFPLKIYIHQYVPSLVGLKSHIHIFNMTFAKLKFDVTFSEIMKPFKRLALSSLNVIALRHCIYHNVSLSSFSSNPPYFLPTMSLVYRDAPTLLWTATIKLDHQRQLLKLLLIYKTAERSVNHWFPIQMHTEEVVHLTLLRPPSFFLSEFPTYWLLFSMRDSFRYRGALI